MRPKTFLEIALENGLGIWRGKAQIITNKENSLPINVDPYGHLRHLMNLPYSAKRITSILSHDHTCMIPFTDVKGVQELRVVDNSFENNRGRMNRKALSKVGPFTFHLAEKGSELKGMTFSFRMKFKQVLNFPGIHEVCIELKMNNQENDFYGRARTYDFMVRIDKSLVDRCKTDPRIYAELKERFAII